MTKPIKITLLILSAAFALYVLSALFLPDVLTDILAPACDLLAAGLIFQAVLTSKNKRFRLNFILMGAAVLSRAAADSLWPIDFRLLNIDPGGNGWIAFLYFGTNVFLLCSTLAYTVNRLRKWDTVQLIVDAAAFSMATLWLLWVVLFEKQYSSLGFLQNNSVIHTASIVIDIFLVFVSGIWFLTAKMRKMPSFIYISVISVFCFAAVDLIYYYLYARGFYIPDSLIDAFYMLALFGFALSIRMYYARYPSGFTMEGTPGSTTGNRYKALLMLVYPAIIVIFEGFVFFDIAFFVILIFSYAFARNYIRKAIQDRERLKRELLTNQELEHIVAEQTRDLQSANAELLQKNEELEFAALHDSLTGLYNRNYFMEKLEEFINTAADSTEKVTLLIWNVDNLKGINDTYGHHTGDQLLVWHAGNVKKLFESSSVLARLSGDEFALLHKGAAPQEPLRIAERVIRSLRGTV